MFDLGKSLLHPRKRANGRHRGLCVKKAKRIRESETRTRVLIFQSHIWASPREPSPPIGMKAWTIISRYLVHELLVSTKGRGGLMVWASLCPISRRRLRVRVSPSRILLRSSSKPCFDCFRSFREGEEGGGDKFPSDM